MKVLLLSVSGVYVLGPCRRVTKQKRMPRNEAPFLTTLNLQLTMVFNIFGSVAARVGRYRVADPCSRNGFL